MVVMAIVFDFPFTFTVIPSAGILNESITLFRLFPLIFFIAASDFGLKMVFSPHAWFPFAYLFVRTPDFGLPCLPTICHCFSSSTSSTIDSSGSPLNLLEA